MSNVSVICRCKPFSLKKNENTKVILDEDGKTIIIDHGKSEKISFIFDNILVPTATQDEVYQYVLPLIKDALCGYNGTILTYGQTGSGKTYTMNGSEGTNQGIIPRAIDTIFELINSSTKYKTTVTLSCLEIYQEKLFDLLTETTSVTFPNNVIPLRIRQTSLGSVWVEGLIEKSFLTIEEFHHLYTLVQKRRSVGSHQMNSESSRSHLCCILNLQMISLFNGEKINSKLHLIDLAGSEMVRKTSVQGTRLNEAKYINKSLSALGNVINALTSTLSTTLSSSTATTTTTVTTTTTTTTAASSTLPTSATNENTKHIPYRDSKLTRLLQDSLSGNSKTLLFLTISMATDHLSETLSTLRFGERARKLRTKPKINIELNDLNAYKQNYIKLEKQFLSLKGTIEELKKEVQEKDQIIDELRRKETHTARERKEDHKEESNCTNCERLNEIIRNLHRKNETTGDREELSLNSFNFQHQSPSKSANSPPPPNQQLHIQDPAIFDETRCAVCGLNEMETDQLKEDTGESLGGFFTCDGNCGNIFHVKCAGEVGDGGQYTVPSGEWYCTTCSVLDDEGYSDVINKRGLPSQSSVLKSAENGGGVGIDRFSDDLIDDTTPQHQQQQDQQDQGQDQQQYLRVLSEYHKIRRERNRILNQWQHEQRLLKQRNEWRDKTEYELNQELITAKEIINKLQNDMCSQLRERKSLEKRLSEAFTEMMIMKNEKMKIMTSVEDTLNGQTTGKTGKGQDSFQSPSPSSSSPSDGPPPHPHLPLNQNQNPQILLPVPQNPYSVLTAPANEIPKPWKKKSSSLKKSSSTSSSSIETNQSSSLIPSPSVPLDSHQHSTQKGGKNRLPTSPIRQTSLSSTTPLHTSLDLPHLLISDSMDPNSLLESSSVSSASCSSFGLTSSSTKSPFNKRLINLIQIVKEETGSFAEIRKKYKERETERSLLKSRHHSHSHSQAQAGAQAQAPSEGKKSRNCEEENQRIVLPSL